MHYHISYSNPNTHFIDIKLIIENVQQEATRLQLPAWRPGRYELANFAKNIRTFVVTDEQGRELDYKKITKDLWEIQTKDCRTLTVQYSYYAFQMDAGNSLLDDSQLYINFINCLLYEESRLHAPCEVKLNIPDHYKIACGLPATNNTLKAKDYYQLVDSPMIASPTLQHLSYEAGGTTFHIWIQGQVALEGMPIIEDFKAFSESQIRMFGEFPEPEFHFLLQILPYKHYHGVEHHNSTVITMGPDYKLYSFALYKELLGVSSHELFHAWNIIRIRPKEMLPYDFARENYFMTGFVAEGLTTYYGDLFLAKSGVFTTEQYLAELNNLLRKHFNNPGRLNLSVAASSFDLWLDGYVAGIPGRKGSIYTEGAVAALILDLELRQMTQNKKSLDDVMRLLWQRFGKPYIGYTFEDYRAIVKEVAGQDLEDYFEECISGTHDLTTRLENALEYVGCKLHFSDNPSAAEDIFGIKASYTDGRAVVDAIAPGSPAELVLSKDDELIGIHHRKVDNNLDELFMHSLMLGSQVIEVHFFRNGHLHTALLEPNGNHYFRQYSITVEPNSNISTTENRLMWLGE